MSETRPQPYRVRDIHLVARGSDVLVREYTLDPGESIPWHRHTNVSDYYYPARHELAAGGFAKVTPPTVHHVSNPGKKTCRFLLIQGVGKYDFVKAAD